MTIKIIVPVSGGKDSQACLKMAVQEYGAKNVLGLFCDTKFEHPETYRHISFMRILYGSYIHTVCGGDVLSKSLKYNRFPGGGARHCTDELKIRETRIFLKEFSEKTVLYKYGMACVMMRVTPERRGMRTKTPMIYIHRMRF